MRDKQQDVLNVLYSSDDNYVQHMGVSIYSLLEKNQEFSEIKIYVVDNEIRQENRERIEMIVDSFSNASVHWISFQKWKGKLSLNMKWDISISSYARLFVASMLPENMDKVLYLDCDMVIQRTLRTLWNYDLGENIVGAVQDSVSTKTKVAIGVSEKEPYFNAGMLLIDLLQWRRQEVEKLCLEFLKEHKGRVVHHDQGVLNGVLKRKIYRLPLDYNLMTVHYILDRKRILKYYEEKSAFYNDVEINNAKENVVVIHYTPSFTSRPWVKGCCHPLRKVYWEVLKKTPWKGTREQENKLKWYARMIEWRYRCLPF